MYIKSVSGVLILATAFIASGYGSEVISYSKQKLPTVIFVPGLFGNRLNSGNKRLWMNVGFMSLHPYKFIKEISLKYDPITHTTSNINPKSDIHVPGAFGDVSPIETLTPGKSYFWTLTSFLKDSLGYDYNNIRAAPYDFRKAPNELGKYFESLTKLIETSRRNSSGPIILISHSYGGLLMNYYLNTKTSEWKKNNIASMITMGVPWGGSKKSFILLASGVGAFGKISQAISRSFPSTTFLLPNAEIHRNETIMEKDGRRYAVEDIDKILSEMGAADSVKMHADTKNLLSMTSAPGVKLHCIYSANVKTSSSLKYGDSIYTDKNVKTRFPDTPLIMYEDGDGTVGLKSLELCNSFSKHQCEPVAIYKMTDPKITHSGMLSNKQTFKYIGDIIANEAYSRTSKDIRNKKCISSELFSYVPADFKIKHNYTSLR